MSEWKNRNVLITGASYGIGEAFAEQLASDGANLILTARSQDRLDTLAANLRTKFSIRVEIIVADLAASTGARKIYEAVKTLGMSVDLLINNAGFGALDEFAAFSLPRQLEMIQVNVSALVELTHLFLQEMKARKNGAILNVASTAAFQPVPYFSVYAATKAFVLSFSQGLWEECKPYGVRVLALCPGSTESNFQNVAGSQKLNAPRHIQTSPQVVKAGLAALSQGRSYVVSGAPNKILVHLQRFVPRDVIIKMTGKLFNPHQTET